MCYEEPLKNPIPQSQLQIEDVLMGTLAEFWLNGQDFEDAICDIMEENATTRVPIQHHGETIYHDFNTLVQDNYYFCEHAYFLITIIKEEMRTGLKHEGE